jgi:predicted nucleotide-binding protein
LVGTIAPDTIEELLKAQNITFTASEIPYGRQFRFSDGAILNAYSSGKAVWQGKPTATSERVKSLLGQDNPPAGLTEYTNERRQVSNTASNKVFIVYGHDVECREQLELLLRRMRLEPVILQNLVGAGRTDYN